MKTKQYIYIIAAAIAVWFGVDDTKAQGYYFPGDTIRGSGFTYICETPWAEEGVLVITFPDNIRLRNINNVFTGIGQRKDGVLLSPLEDLPKFYIDDNDAFKKFHNIINSVLSTTEKNNAKGSEYMLFVDLFISPTTGKIVDVEFNTHIDDGFAKIAPEKYYQMETMLKQQVTYQINDIGRRYNYNYYFIPYKGSFLGQTIN